MNAYLCRHGESTANAGAATSRVEEIPLTPLGHKQAAELAARLPRIPRVIASNYLRARQTAEAYAADHLIEIMPQVREFTYLNFGGAETTRAERMAKIEEYWTRADPDWNDSTTGRDPYSQEYFDRGVESFNDLLARVDYTIEMIREGAPVVIFTHGNFMKMFMRRLDGGDMSMAAAREYLYSFELSNCAVIRTDGRTYVLE